MKSGRAAASGALFLLLAIAWCSAAAVAAEPVRITKEELRERMGRPGIVIVDVRLGEGGLEWNRKITGSVREDPLNVDSWAQRYPKDKPIVLY